MSVRKLEDLKTWVPLMPLRANTAAGTTMISSEGPDQVVLIFASATTGNYLYDPFEDGMPITMPGPALAGTFGAGACGRYHPAGPTGTAQAGSGAQLLVTNLSLLADLRPRGSRYYKGFVTGGTGAGQYFEIVSNTNQTGASRLVIQKPGGGALTTALDATSTYILYTGRFYVLNAGTVAAGIFKYYDWATKTWSGNLGTTNLPATIGTDCRMLATPSTFGAPFATGTATAGGATTLTNGAKAWATNQWTNSQVRITGGTGAGQTRSIASNTGTVLTVSAAWTTNPDATSTYEITGNDDYLYVLGNNAVTLYRYSISGNTWAVLTPGAARAGAAVAGCSANWIYAATPSNWTNENAIGNGRYIYSFRGGVATLDVYDIAGNTWASAVTYGNAAETFAAGSAYSYRADRIYIDSAASGFIFALDIPSMSLVPVSTWLVTQSTAVVGDKLCTVDYSRDGKTVSWLYKWNHSQTTAQRMLIV